MRLHSSIVALEMDLEEKDAGQAELAAKLARSEAMARELIWGLRGEVEAQMGTIKSLQEAVRLAQEEVLSTRLLREKLLPLRGARDQMPEAG